MPKVTYKLGYSLRRQQPGPEVITTTGGGGGEQRAGRAGVQEEEGDAGPTSYPKQTRHLLARLLEAETANAHKERAQVLHQLGELFVETQDWAKVVSYARRELEGVERRFPPGAFLYRTQCRLEQYDLAIRYTQEYLRMAEQLEDREEVLDSLFDLILCHIQSGESEEGTPEDFKVALATIKRAASHLKTLELSEKQTKCLQARLFVNYGIVLNDTGRSDDAITKINLSRSIYATYGARMDEANALCNLAFCYERKGDLANAVRMGKAELSIYQALDYVEGQVNALWELGQRVERLHNFADAIAVYQKYVDLCRMLEDTAQAERGLRAIKDVRARQAKLTQVGELELQILSALKRRDARAESRLRGLRGTLYAELGMDREALADFEGQRQIAVRLASEPAQLNKILLALGDTYFRLQAYPECIKCLRQVLLVPGGAGVAEPVDQRIAILGKLGLSYAAVPTSTCQQVTSVLEEWLVLATSVGDLESQHQALVHLRKAYARFRQEGKAAQCTDKLALVRQQMQQAAAAEEEAEGVVEAEYGSVDSDELTDGGEPGSEEDGVEEELETEGGSSVPEEEVDSLPTSTCTSRPRSARGPAQARKRPPRRLILTSSPDHSQASVRLTTSTRTAHPLAAVAVLLEPERELGSPGSREDPISLDTSDADDEDLLRPGLGLPRASPLPVSRPIGLVPVLQPGTLPALPKSLAPRSSRPPTGCPNMPMPQEAGEENQAPPAHASPTKPLAMMGTLCPLPVTPSTPTLPARRSHRPAPGASAGVPEERRRSSLPGLVTLRPSPSPASSCPRTPPSALTVRIAMGPDGASSFSIPCVPGPGSGTPRTVGWLMQEARRRYARLHGTMPRIRALTTKSGEGWQETLFPEDLVDQVLMPNQLVRAEWEGANP